MLTQDEIIEMARQTGMELDDSFVLEEEQIWYFCKENFIAFAKLVADAAAAKEREECLEIADNCAEGDLPSSVAANCIRARGEA